MLAESLIVLACVQRTGCSEVSALYAAQNPLVVERLGTYERALPLFMRTAVLPLGAFVAGGAANVQLYGPVRIQASAKLATILFEAVF